MSKMKLPGFTAGSSNAHSRRTLPDGRQLRRSGQRGPGLATEHQFVIVISRKRAFSDAAPRRSTTWVHTNYESVRTTCDPDSWICGHRRPDAESFTISKLSCRKGVKT